jgi:23S rRNA (guanosine2251-2'-O)-methyltransferase
MPRSRSAPRRRGTPDSAAASTHWLTGLHPVREALRAGRRRIDCLWIRRGEPSAAQRELRELARASGVPIEEVDTAQLEQRADGDGNPQGVALRVGPLPELSLGSLVDEVSGSVAGGRLLALDGLEDPQNLGAVARVAESAGVGGLILTQRRAPPLSPAVSRASAGAIEWLKVARVPNLARALEQLQARGYWVLAASPASGAGLYELDDRALQGNLVVVLGAEGAGIRPGVLARADHCVEIPMQGHIQSLNVSTAGAVILYDLVRRARPLPGP